MRSSTAPAPGDRFGRSGSTASRIVSPGRKTAELDGAPSAAASPAKNSTRSASPGATLSVRRLPSRSSPCCWADRIRSATAPSNVTAERSSPSAKSRTASFAARQPGIIISTPLLPRRLGSCTWIVFPVAWAVAAASVSPQRVCQRSSWGGAASPAAVTNWIVPDQARGFPPPQVIRMATGRSEPLSSAMASARGPATSHMTHMTHTTTTNNGPTEPTGGDLKTRGGREMSCCEDNIRG